MRNYIDLTTIYNETIFGDYIMMSGTTEISDIIKEFYSITNEYDNYNELFLLKDDITISCGSKFVMATSKKFLDTAYGNVLIVGLGLGMVIFPLLNDETITKIKIIEKEPSIIEHVGNKILNYDILNKVTIENGEGYTYFNNIGTEEKYDTIYLDFWNRIDINNIEELTNLKENYRPFLRNENSILMSWCEDIKHLLYKSFNP